MITPIDTLFVVACEPSPVFSIETAGSLKSMLFGSVKIKLTVSGLTFQI
jgi:uncharacterized protein (AIM24 family)